MGAARAAPRTAGFFNPVHPWTVQVLGDAGAEWFAALAPRAQRALARKLKAAGMTTLIVAAGADLPSEPAWTAAGIVLQRRAQPAHLIVHELRRELAAQQAREQTVHGVLLAVHGTGVLLEGLAGAGKSALALELVSRGHALVADDAVELRRPAPGIVLGRAPATLAGFLEARGLGVLDVRRMHGARALRRQVRLDLIVALAAGRRPLSAGERLSGARAVRRVLGEPVPVLALPRPPSSGKGGHNLAALVEAACLDRRLRLDGIEADAVLARRQARAIAQQRPQ